MITEGGSDWRKVIVMNALTKGVVEDTLKNVKFSGVSWKGKEGFYYSSYDVPKEGSQLSGKTQLHKLLYHKLGTPQSSDVLVFGGDKQPNRYIFGSVTEDQNYLVITAAQATSVKVLYAMDLRITDAPFIPIDEDYETDISYLENDGARFLFSTNFNAPNTRVIAVDLKNPKKENWTEVIPETNDVLTPGSVGGKIFAEYLIDAKSIVKQYDLNGKLDWEIELPGIGSVGGFGAEKEDTDLYYAFTSFTIPAAIYKYDIPSGKSTLYRQP
jgi:prolyl oligopeptidase